MLSRLKLLLLLLTLGLLSACQSQNLEDYALQGPKLNPQQFFNGHLSGWGIYEDRDGVVKQRFSIEMEAAWHGDLGKLQQNIHYQNGDTLDRIWTFNKLKENHYRIAASDAQHHGEGHLAGNSGKWSYQLPFSEAGQTDLRDVEEWMYAIDENTLMQKILVKKFGVPAGYYTIFVQRTITLNEAVDQMRNSVEQIGDFLFGKPK